METQSEACQRKKLKTYCVELNRPQTGLYIKHLEHHNKLICGVALSSHTNSRPTIAPLKRGIDEADALRRDLVQACNLVVKILLVQIDSVRRMQKRNHRFCFLFA